MSTISHIIYDSLFELYEETSEPQSVFGQFNGFNVYFILEEPAFKKMEIEADYLTLICSHTELPIRLKFWGGDIVRAEFEDSGALVIFKGGTRTAEHLIKKDFSIFNIK